jgi:hypothetical protein
MGPRAGIPVPAIVMNDPLASGVKAGDGFRYIPEPMVMTL